MDKIRQAEEFHETHKMKIGRDYRLEFLNLSKEDIYDFLEVKYSNYIHGWRQKLWESERQVEALKHKIENLQSGMCEKCKEKLLKQKQQQ